MTLRVSARYKANLPLKQIGKVEKLKNIGPVAIEMSVGVDRGGDRPWSSVTPVG